MGNSFLAVSLVAVWVEAAKVLHPLIAVKVNTSPTPAAKKIAGWVGGAVPISSRRKNIPQLLATTAGGQCLIPARHPAQRNE
jgi:hypothetical protein